MKLVAPAPSADGVWRQLRLLPGALDDGSPIDGEVALIFNTTEGWQSLKDSQSIRASALKAKVPQFTTAAASVAAVEAIGALRGTNLEVRSLQDYYA